MKLLAILLCAVMSMPLMAQRTKNEKGKDMKTLTVYYSFTAGNTKGIAEKVHAAVGGDIVRLEPVKPYPTDYDAAVSQGEEEVQCGYQPEIMPLGVDLKDYDRIIVGTPTWWYTMAPVVLTFLSQNDFTGKTVIPFMTNAGWPGMVIKDMTRVAEKNGAKVENGHEFRFSAGAKHRDRMETPASELEEWIKSVNR